MKRSPIYAIIIALLLAGSYGDVVEFFGNNLE